MSRRWELTIPFRSRADELSDVGAAARHLHLDDPHERDVCRHLVLAGVSAGLRTAGELIDHLGALGPPERRRLLDSARAELGLPSTADVEAREAYQRAQLALAMHSPRDEHGRFQLCHAEGCYAHPTEGPHQLPATTNVKRWFCPRHRDQAQPGDLEPPEPRFVHGLDYSAIPVGAEAERQRREAKALRAEDRRRNEERQAEAERREAIRRERERARIEAELPPGYGGPA